MKFYSRVLLILHNFHVLEMNDLQNYRLRSSPDSTKTVVSQKRRLRDFMKELQDLLNKRLISG